MRSGRGDRPRLRVLFFAPMPPPYGGVAEISRGLFESKLSEEFDLVLLDFSKKTSDRIRTFTFEWGDIAWGLVFWGRLIRALLRHRPDLLYVASSFDQSYLRNALYMATARVFGTKVVCHFHGYRKGGIFGNPGALLRGLLRLTSRTYNRMIFLSPSLQDSMEEILGRGKGTAIPNFIDPAEFHPSSGLRNDPARVVFIGRVTERKGIYVLLETAARLREGGSRFALDIVGLSETEEEEARVKSAVDTLGLADITTFHGVRAGKEKAAILSQAAMLVLPSWADIFPVVVLEAYASALPVVAAAVAAVPDMVQDGRQGFLCRPRDPESLSEAMRTLLDDQELRVSIGERNRAIAETEYSRDLIAAQVAALFRDVASKN